MEKMLGVTEARNSLKAIVDGVQFQGDTFIIQRHGLPAAAIVSVDIYEQWKQEQQALFDLIHSFQASSGDNDPEEIMALVLEAQQAVREEWASETQS
ncbi:MAG: type II toxin-antitoxin system Phd/YefM family antitoxin [Anaerolinea sp.]|nr:type II toxin-antitoxin system Phd/YefM family antitoxin [Anaerolinea sp.]